MITLIGFIIGMVLGLTGAGGSVFAVPLLMLLGGLSMADAVGVALGAVAASALFGSLRNWRGKTILWAPGVILAASGMLVAPLGQWLGTRIPQFGLLVGFCALAIIIAMRMWLQASRTPEHARVVRGGNFSTEPRPSLLCSLSRSGQFEMRPRCVSGLVIGGAVVGLLSGLFGVGGGFLIVPLLLALSPISMGQAVSTSLVIIAAISASGFISHALIHTPLNTQLLGLMVVGGLLGMSLSQLISHKIANATLQKLFSVSLIVVCITTLIIHH